MKQSSSENVRVMGLADKREVFPAAGAAADHSPPPLPDEPLVVIEQSSGWAPVRFGDLWTYRELLYFLIWRDLKVRYKQAALGLAWVIMQPLLVTIIFTVFLGMLARVPSDDFPYPLFVYAGLLPWTFFSNAVVGSGNSIVGNANLITKVYFPRVIIPAAAIGARLVDLGVAFVILVGMMLYYRVGVTWSILMLPVLVVMLTLFSLGLGLVTSALNVKYRDVGIVLPVMIQLWMFVSPVVYSSTLVPARWQTLYSLNPLAGMLEGFRAALLGRPFNWSALAVSAAVTVALLVYSVYMFRRVEKSFADLA
jgi:lipopolysaccharide transport system permease protein